MSGNKLFEAQSRDLGYLITEYKDTGFAVDYKVFAKYEEAAWYATYIAPQGANTFPLTYSCASLLYSTCPGDHA